MQTEKEKKIGNLKNQLRVLKSEKERIERRLPEVIVLITGVKVDLFLTRHEISMGDRIKIIDGKKTSTGMIKEIKGSTVTLEDKTGKVKKVMLSKKDVKITIVK